MTKKFEKNFSGKHINMRELRNIAKDKGLHGCYKLKKDELVASLLEKSPEKMPKPALRGEGKVRRPVLPVK